VTASGLPDPAAPVETLSGVGPRIAQRLARLGIRRVEDLLFHLPLRYQDRTRVVPIGGLTPGREAVVEATIDHAEVVLRRRRMLLVRVSDGSGALLLRFFHFSPAQREGLARGVRLRLFGEARLGSGGLEMVHPEYERLAEDAETPAGDALTPVYPTTEGLHQLSLRRLIDRALPGLAGLPELLDPQALPEALRYPLAEAVRFLHRPPPDADLPALLAGRHPAQRRLAFEELLAHHLSLARLRAAVAREPAPPIAPPGALLKAFRASLPFALTGAQERVLAELMTDLAQPHPMSRLVQGDVGSGKTVVAAAACVLAVEAGFQAAVMAPTEILAEQHHASFRDWLAPLGVEVAWVSGRQPSAERRSALGRIAAGEARVVVGTHALFQDQVEFDNLALVVVDEQHRFGVHQRLRLREKASGHSPHQLIMTATPIPRTLAMTAYADLDYSVIDELPPGRQPVQTVAVPHTRRAEVVQRVAAACAEGRQAYWVCTLIEESEALEAEAAEQTHAALADALPGRRLGLVHGRLRPAEKDAVMQAFKAGEIDLLVATTVIEVGVDVPNASLMIIENPERLGLAQLHQLRGRVGRGSAASSCVLLYRAPLSETARARLDALRRTTDGFEIARVDLEIRGPGELLGTRQTGAMQFRVADLARDQDLIPEVQRRARALAESGAPTADALIERWLGEATEFAKV
jgi:ATP-dependent DNA helicase RecG